MERQTLRPHLQSGSLSSQAPSVVLLLSLVYILSIPLLLLQEELDSNAAPHCDSLFPKDVLRYFPDSTQRPSMFFHESSPICVNVLVLR